MIRRLLVLAVASLIVAGPAFAVQRFNPFQSVDIVGRAGDRVPLKLPFTDSRGRAVTLKDLAGDRPILLAPVYYTCANICGVTLSSAMAALAEVPLRPGLDYVFVAYSINPREGPHEAAKAKKDALLRFPGTPDGDGFRFLTGPPRSIVALSKAIGFRFAWDEAIQQYAHATALAAVTPEGRLSRWIYGVGFAPFDLRLALLDAGEGTVGTVADKLLLLCYHYDPETGRYGSLVQGMLVAGGVSTVLVLGLGIGLALWRERRAAARGGPDRP